MMTGDPYLRRGGAAHSTWILLALLAWCAPASGFDEDELAALLETARSEQRMPGLRAAVRLPDGRLVRAAVGLADVEAGIPLDNTVGMPGGSTGKTFAAALAMLLVEDGTLGLDDPASKWLGTRPWFRRLPSSERIRVRHLLSHSSGIADYPGTVSFNVAMVWRVLRHGSARFEPEELISFAGRKKPRFAPGEGYRYTDAGFLVLGRVIEAAAGRDYYELLEERILGPQGLDQVRPARESVLPGITPGYTGGARNLKKDGRMKFDPSSEWTGGGLTTNPTMLVQFFAALAEGRVVQPQSFARMLDGGFGNPAAAGTRYGLGVFVYDGGAAFGHGGLWPGYRSQVTHFLTTGTTVAVQTNRDGRVDLEALAYRIAAIVPAAGTAPASGTGRQVILTSIRKNTWAARREIAAARVAAAVSRPGPIAGYSTASVITSRGTP